MKRQRDGRLIPADSYTINGQEIPQEISVETQRCMYQILNAASIAKSIAITKDSAKMNKNLQNADSQVIRIMNVKMKQNVQIAMMVIIPHTTEFAPSEKPRKKSSK